MADTTNEEKKMSLIPCSFEFHNFETQVGEVRMSCRITRMKDSLYMWIGEADEGKMSDLSVAMMSNYETQPIATKIMGTNEDGTSMSLAKRLAKKCGRPVYVSFNVPVSNITLPAIEKAINAEFNKRKELFMFD